MVLGGGGGDAGEQDGTGVVEEEQGPESSNMEVDNPGSVIEPVEDAVSETGCDLLRR